MHTEAIKSKKKIIVTKIIGGLGNQMFQYAFGRTLAEKNVATLALDISSYGTTFKAYGFHLSHFVIQAEYASQKEITSLRKYKRRGDFMGKFLNRIFADPRKYVAERTQMYDPSMLELTPSCYVEGYWLSEKYFMANKDLLKKEFTLKEPLSDYSKIVAADIVSSPDSVAIHVRQGFAKDIERTKQKDISHVSCPPEYYADAIRIINERVPGARYFVFSDDIEWTKEHIHTGRPTVFVEQEAGKDYEDMDLMRACKHHIISNSTFGWWGAWLSTDEKGSTTIAPAQWTTKPFDTRDLIPERWITLPY